MSDPVRHLWLDLEDTVVTPVVDGWFNTHLINLDKIERVMDEFKPDHLHVFSFAIWNQQELVRFNMGTRPMIETRLGKRFSIVPTVDEDIIPACCSVMRIDPGSVVFSDMSDFWGKQEAFRLFCRKIFANTHAHGITTEVMLLDDVVMNEEFHFPDLRLYGTIHNIDQL
jgi:hypothetical protein